MRASARAQVRTAAAGQDWRPWLAGTVIGMAAALSLALPSRAQEAATETTAGTAQGTIVSHGISIFGDLVLPADFAHLPYVNPDAPKGGEISFGTFGGFDSMNPYSVKGRAAVGSSTQLESILTGTADEIGASYCFMCTTMEYPEDRSWVIFTLRDDVKFSDGTPLTVEDVLFSYETFLNKGLSDFRTVLAEQVQGAEIIGPNQIKYTFKPGVPTRDLPATVGGLPVFSKAHYEAKKLDLEESSLVPLLGSGAYVPDVIDVGRTVTYKRNPDYWAQNLPFGIGMNNFDTIRYEYFAEPNAAFEGFKAGVYTFRVENSSKQWAEGYNIPAVRDKIIRKEALPSGAKATGQSFVFNLRRESWQDPRVREAIGMMFNFEWSNQTLFFGLYKRANSFWENSWLAAEGPPSPEEVAILQPLVDEGLLDVAILTDPPVTAPLSSTDRQLDRRALRAASALLDEAGWIAGDDGMRRNAAGQTLKLEILEDNPTFERVIVPFVENLRALGIDASLNVIDSAQYEVRVRNPAYDFDMIGSFTQTDYYSGAELKQFYGSATADISVFNAAGLKSPAVDRMIDIVMATKTKDELTVATKAMDRVLRAQKFRIPQWFNPDNWVAYYDMYEHPDPLPPYALGQTTLWWFNADKAAALKAKGALK
ncbi:extracellular solute-binding protein [Neotabrizicola sp. VNH66]|uniref:extracellular solute-binding protein n=1 Tax=Neotabrizicola sp. VNH66 TaxID=3400918 RepID=UPI003BFD5BEB